MTDMTHMMIRMFPRLTAAKSSGLPVLPIIEMLIKSIVSWVAKESERWIQGFTILLIAFFKVYSPAKKADVSLMMSGSELFERIIQKLLF